MCSRSRLLSLIGLFLLSPAVFSVPQSVAQSTAPASTPPAPTQTLQSEALDQPATVLRVTTRLVVVDVVATNNKGAPVTDLKAEDFTVQEESVEQPIQVFSFHQSGSGEATPAAN